MILTYSVNLPGPYHIANNIPCQDSFFYKEGVDGYNVGAVADGLGSEKYSDVGSKTAAEAAVTYCCNNLRSKMSDDDVLSIIRSAFSHSYKNVLARANSDGNSEDEYDTTLCLVVYCPDGHICYGQSGDSGIVALLENGHYLQVTSQQRNECGDVYPLCCESKWEFASVSERVCSVMLMTDGILEKICPLILRNEDTTVYIPLAREFLHNNDCSPKNLPQLETAATRYLENYPDLDDDKTVLVLINPALSPATLEESYYREPDWSALREKAKARLYHQIDTAETPSPSSDAPDAQMTRLEVHTSLPTSHIRTGNLLRSGIVSVLAALCIIVFVLCLMYFLKFLVAGFLDRFIKLLCYICVANQFVA